MMPIFDLHADVLMDLVRREERLEASAAGAPPGEPGRAGPELGSRHLARMREGGIAGAALIDCRMAGETAAPAHLERFIQVTKAELAAAEGILHVKTAAHLKRALETGAFAAVVGYEGLSPTGGDLSWIRRLYDEAGVRIAALTHNDDNPYGGGAMGFLGGLTGPDGRPARRALGLTSLGYEAVELMNELGILIDLAHAGKVTRADIITASSKPVMLSHTSAKAVYDNGRNLSDEELKAIADAGGLVGCMTSPAALAPMSDRSNHTLDRYMEHLLHMIDAAGLDHVGLGLHFCDFLYTREEYPLIQGLEHPSEAQAIIERLRKAGISEDGVEKIAWKNFLRVFSQAVG